MVEPGVVLGHVLPVVPEQDDQGVVEQVELAQVGEELADLEVEVGHLGVIEVSDVVEVGHGLEIVVEVLLEQRVAGPALELAGDVGVDPAGRAVREALLERRGWQVGDVGVPEMEEEVELLGGVLVEPGKADPVDDRARRPRPARGWHVVVVSPDEPVLHGEEMVDGAGHITVTSEQRGHPQRALIEVGSRVEMGHDARANAELHR